MRVLRDAWVGWFSPAQAAVTRVGLVFHAKARRKRKDAKNTSCLCVFSFPPLRKTIFVSSGRRLSCLRARCRDARARRESRRHVRSRGDDVLPVVRRSTTALRYRASHVPARRRYLT